MDRTLYFHVGLYKTGSTFLQKVIFPELEDIDVLVLPDFDLLSDKEWWPPSSIPRFIGRSPLVWREVGDRFFRKVLEEADRNNKGGDKRNLLISDEGGIFRLRKGIGDPWSGVKHLQEMRKIALNYFSDFKVILSVRRQDTWLASAYTQIATHPKYSPGYDNPSQEHFETWVDEQLSYDKKYFSEFGVNLEYSTLLTLIEEVIPMHKVKVIPFEILAQDPRCFVKQICFFIDQDPPKVKLKQTNKKSIQKNEWQIEKSSASYIRLRPSRFFYHTLGFSRLKYKQSKVKIKIKNNKNISKKILQYIKNQIY